MTFAPLAAIRDIARIAGYPHDKRHLIQRLAREGTQRIEGNVARGQRGFLYDLDTLPAAIRAALPEATVTQNASAPFSDYITAPPLQRQEAERRQRMMYRVKALLSEGQCTTAVYATVAAEFKVSTASVKRAWNVVRTAIEADWLGLLVKGYKGRKPEEIDPRVWDAFLKDYGRVEQPQLQATWERVQRKAKREGWGDVPSAKTLKRRWDALPAGERVYMRDGEKALGQLFPYAERDRSGMLPLDGFNIDGRIWDLFVEFPDGSVMRPTVSVVQDEATNYLLGWIVGKTESGDMYRRVLCNALTTFGIPKRILFDNTRAAANKTLTAGAENRNRFKDKPSDIEGILPRIGCEVNFALPFNGRSKLVERLFGELKERTEKDPRLEGAYAGRSPSDKPANYGKCAVPLVF